MTNSDIRRQMLEVWNKLEQNIAEYGHTVIAVFADMENGKLPFSYTVGNSAKRLPELLVMGLNEKYTLNVLTRLMVERGEKFGDGEIVSLGGKYPLMLIDATPQAREEYMALATRYHGADDYAVMQVILPDSNGRWPWQAGCDRPYSQIPVYAVRPPLQLH